jgi:ribosomal protein S17E
MGKIKSKEVRRSAKELTRNEIEFSTDFKENKEILAKVPMGKKLRNQLAGLLAKTKKQEN